MAGRDGKLDSLASLVVELLRRVHTDTQLHVVCDICEMANQVCSVRAERSSERLKIWIVSPMT